MRQVLVISENKEPALAIKDALVDTSKIDLIDCLDIAVAKFKQEQYDLTFFETQLLLELAESLDQPIDETLKTLRSFNRSASIVVFSPLSLSRTTIHAVRLGASDYLYTPIQPDEVRLVANGARASNLIEAELEYLKDEFWSEKASEIVVTKSSKMQEVYSKVKSAAPTASTILLTGETGVGKSLIAQLIHEHSVRRAESFVSVHCGALPENLVESELFGHEKGSFTGAIKRKLGRFEIANKGSIFLDEVGTISAGTQIKLLKVLQDSTFQRVGGESDIKVDVRIISATNENLKELSEKKSFRNDLFFRLNVFPIDIPPLRERVEDIPTLVNIFIKQLNNKYLKSIESLDDLALNALCSYSWPGNIRELENIMERAFIIETSNKIKPESLPLEIMEQASPSAVFDMSVDVTLAEAREKAINDLERQYLKELLSKKKGKIKETAEVAGVGVRQIHKLMTKYKLTRDQFKD